MKWGLRWEFFIIIVIIICLLIATLGLSELGLLSRESGDDVIYTGPEMDSSFSYGVLESEIEEAGGRFYRAKYPNGAKKNVFISYSKLKSTGYIGKLTDGSGRNCTGYVEITTSGSAFGYVKCPRYRTEGYESSYE